MHVPSSWQQAKSLACRHTFGMGGQFSVSSALPPPAASGNTVFDFYSSLRVYPLTNFLDICLEHWCRASSPTRQAFSCSVLYDPDECHCQNKRNENSRTHMNYVFDGLKNFELVQT
jgi:hypothetical protein